MSGKNRAAQYVRWVQLGAVPLVAQWMPPDAGLAAGVGGDLSHERYIVCRATTCPVTGRSALAKRPEEISRPAPAARAAATAQMAKRTW